jgi:predicted transcriptional regulator
MNRYQLAMELGIDWKSVDRHVDLLLRHGLLETVEASGERAYRLSERGRRLLELLEEMAEIEKDTSREK